MSKSSLLMIINA